MSENNNFRVAQYLQKGAENAIKAPELAQKMGLKPGANLRFLIEADRAQNALILSSGNGYFLPADGEKGREEMERFAAEIDKRARSTFMASKGVRKELGIPDGQLFMSEV
jgi:hypothetical protein